MRINNSRNGNVGFGAYTVTVNNNQLEKQIFRVFRNIVKKSYPDIKLIKPVQIHRGMGFASEARAFTYIFQGPKTPQGIMNEKITNDFFKKSKLAVSPLMFDVKTTVNAIVLNALRPPVQEPQKLNLLQKITKIFKIGIAKHNNAIQNIRKPRLNKSA